MKSASEFHKESENAREQDRHIDALKLIEEAIVGYQKAGNLKGAALALQSRVLIYKHLFLLTQDKIFSTLARKDAEVSLEIAQENNLSDILSSCYFRLGEIAAIEEELDKSVEFYKKALDLYQGTKAEKGDYKYHLGTVMYMNGNKKEGKGLMLEGLKGIQDNRSEVDSFVANVWESGCYMRLAEVLRKDEPGEANKYLKFAREIINKDERLIIRKRQWEKLVEKFK